MMQLNARGKWVGSLLLALTLLHNTPARAQEAENQKSVVPEWGHFYDPDDDCTLDVDKDTNEISLTVPGTAHDLSIENNQMNAPVVLQTVSGDWDFVVKVAGEWKPGAPTVAGRAGYQGAGIVLMQDARNYIRLEHGAFTNQAQGDMTHYANFEVRLNGQLMRLGQTTDFPLPAGKDIWFALERRGNQVRGSASLDGKNWGTLGIKPFVENPQCFIGVVAINASQTEFTPRFSQRKFVQHENRERDEP